jgi:hypothetical protein
MIHGELSRGLKDANTKATAAEQEVILVNANNQQLARKMLDLVKTAEDERAEPLANPSVQEELNELDRGIRDARRDWRVIKSVISGIVVGSGVEWATNTELLGLVLDEDEEVD